jgi:NAD(P)-dependent dehydrogenase (short-subunit alcohol dehydrogenase family)
MDQVAVVSGADRGLGYELCKGLLVKGWHEYHGNERRFK